MARRDDGLAGPGVMLISAALFAYFGFFAGIAWNGPSIATGQPVLQWVFLGWTLKGSAVGFAAAAGLTFVAKRAANLLYSAVGLLGAALLLVDLGLDYVDKQHSPLVPSFLLLLFAVWNGYGSWTGLRAVTARRPDPSDAPGSSPADADR